MERAGSKGRRCCVLDIETIPDRYARTLAGRRGAIPGESPLHEVRTISMLRFIAGSDGALRSFDLVSWHANDYAEPDMLAMADETLAGVLSDDGVLATFNGIRFDLPTLRLRQLRWRQCVGTSIRTFARGAGDHMDVMRELASGGMRFPTLADACAAVGFSIRGMTPIGTEPGVPYEVEKCELDVLGTTVLMLHLLAERRASVEPLVRGLPTLGDYVRQVAVRRPHLERFALNPLLREDARAWGTV